MFIIVGVFILGMGIFNFDWLIFLELYDCIFNIDWLIFVGGIEEYGVMVDEVFRRYFDIRLMGLGFSMGANVVVKYVGEDILR